MNAQSLFDQLLFPCRLAVDATCGRGHDTIKLARLAEKVYAFDIQEQAITSAQARTAGYDHVVYHHTSFVNIPELVKESIDLLIFNLGYLPGGRKQITTQADFLGICLQDCLPKLTSGGRALIMAYPGHPSGASEVEMLDALLKTLDQHYYDSFVFRHLNGRNHPPVLYLIERSAR